ncbi:hypothetical protein V5799_014511 [Amblyomma americanum]|uniref:Reverse transcriptase domain-containing protein n=1 Tax=Amblyomma americanum TaxID=6943 RepID=A0AAQ4E2T4_AMBAM
MLFTACLQEVFRGLNWELLGIRINEEYLNNLRFADDIALLSHSGGELQSKSMINVLDRQSRIVGLKIDMHKIKIMFNSLATEQKFKIGSEVLEVVKEYVYLGQVVSADPYNEREVTRRIRMG